MLAHTLSVVLVQSGVALDVLDDSPEESREAMANVREAPGRRCPNCAPPLDLLRGTGGTGGGVTGGSGAGVRMRPPDVPSPAWSSSRNSSTSSAAAAWRYCSRPIPGWTRRCGGCPRCCN
ncbi:histidine kinase [Streptacidiphilus sp. 4-A2]|nr:histidine kinase [Streptacidiphilus sp. 4-A2]